MDNDYELLYLAKEGNEEAINILRKKYFKLLYNKVKSYNKITKIDLDELLNASLLSFYTAVDNYRDDTKFATYLAKCVDNSLLNYYKSINRDKNKVLNEAISLEETNIMTLSLSDNNRDNPEMIFFNNLNYDEFKERIIEELTWREELIFLLREQDFSPKEISEITDNNIKTVYNIIRRIQNKVIFIMSN